MLATTKTFGTKRMVREFSTTWANHAKRYGMKTISEHTARLALAAEQVLDASWYMVEPFSSEDQAAVLSIMLMCVVANIKDPEKAIGASIKLLKSHDWKGSSGDSDRWFPRRTWEPST